MIHFSSRGRADRPVKPEVSSGPRLPVALDLRLIDDLVLNETLRPEPRAYDVKRLNH